MDSRVAFLLASPLPVRTSAQFSRCCPQRRLFSARSRVRMQTAPPSVSQRRPGARKGFVEEMRFVAMRLHTKDQAPKEGAQEESALPISQWRPKEEDFLQFLVDSLHVYQYFENDLVQNEEFFHRFRNTGLERCQALRKDIEWMTRFGHEPGSATDAAIGYVNYLKDLVVLKPESVLCHWYNYYFAHTAGGRMIGRQVMGRLFGGRKFAFYEWDSDVRMLLAEVRTIIDDVAKEWSRELKDECLTETGLAFGYSGSILQSLAKTE